MRLLFFKDKRIRLKYKKAESLRTAFRFIIRSENIALSKRFRAAKSLSNLPRSSTLSQIHNHCVFTGRSRGVLKPYHVSRIQFRDLINQGILPGYSRSVW